MKRPGIEQLEENLRSEVYNPMLGGEIALQLIDYIKELEKEIEYLRKNQRTGRLVFGDLDLEGISLDSQKGKIK